MRIHDLELGAFGEAREIAELRKTSPVFDEICRDYEVLQAELAKLTGRDDASDPDWYDALEETLAALREEIAVALKRKAPHPTVKENQAQEKLSKNGDTHAS